MCCQVLVRSLACLTHHLDQDARRRRQHPSIAPRNNIRALKCQSKEFLLSRGPLLNSHRLFPATSFLHNFPRISLQFNINCSLCIIIIVTSAPLPKAAKTFAVDRLRVNVMTPFRDRSLEVALLRSMGAHNSRHLVVLYIALNEPQARDDHEARNHNISLSFFEIVQTLGRQFIHSFTDGKKKKQLINTDRDTTTDDDDCEPVLLVICANSTAFRPLHTL